MKRSALVLLFLALTRALTACAAARKEAADDTEIYRVYFCERPENYPAGGDVLCAEEIALDKDLSPQEQIEALLAAFLSGPRSSALVSPV
ncbi:MAG: hypothetical protein IKN53_00380, partial [Oscillibacter sp.]|nr:hypothetical protein [Oscillibacter sp.]